MNARHATHPAEYDEGCPDCTGDYPQPAPRRGWLPLLAAVLLLAALALLTGEARR